MTERARAIEKEKLEREERENERQAVVMSEEKKIYIKGSMLVSRDKSLSNDA